MSERVPVTVVTGFLGAGKTTLIRALLEEAAGVRIGLVVNEFGDLGFDGAQLAGCLDAACGDDVVELTNGCLCCTVADDFVPALERLLDRTDPPQRIVIETSGLALPQPLIAAFAWPTVKPRVTVDAVVTLVDVPAVADGRFADDPARVAAERRADAALDHHSPLEELFEDQLRAADLVVLSKVEGVAAPTLARVRTAVQRQVRAGVPVVAVSAGGTAPVFGLAAAVEDDLEARRGHHDPDEDHEHDDFDSRVVRAAFASREAAHAALSAFIADPRILRVKGSVAVGDRPAPLFVQAVGPRLETWFGRPGEAPTGLVVIGLQPLDDAALAALGARTAA